MRCPMLWRCPIQIPEDSKMLQNACQSHTFEAANPQGLQRWTQASASQKKGAAQTLRKTQAAANAKRPFRTEALILEGAPPE